MLLNVLFESGITYKEMIESSKFSQAVQIVKIANPTELNDDSGLHNVEVSATMLKHLVADDDKLAASQRQV